MKPISALRRGQWLGAGLALLCLALALRHGGGTGIVAALLTVAAAGLWGWISNHRRYRAIADTPTARIASAPQGYTELQGIGRLPEGVPVYAPLTGLPCLWYRLRVEERDGERWRRVAEDASDASFVLDDGSGQCLVDPEAAEIRTQAHETRTEGTRRLTQWMLVPGCRIYALGHFVTRSAHAERPSRDTEVRELLAQWKQDRPSLARRFDLDGDGEIDPREWALVRAAARREIDAERRDDALAPDLHLLRQPPDGRPYLISDQPAQRLARRYRLWSWAHLLLFFLALAGLGWLSSQSPGRAGAVPIPARTAGVLVPSPMLGT